MENSSYLLKDKTSKLILKFSVPCILSLLMTCLYNIVDQIFVGQGIGYLGNAATGIIFPITLIGVAFAQMLGDGVATRSAIAMGQNTSEGIHRYYGNAAMASFGLGVLFAAAFYLAGDSLLLLLGATEETLPYAHDYAFVLYAMLPVYCLGTTLTSVVRNDGAPRISLLAMLLGALVNIIGDYLTIFVFKMGMRGAALATITGQALTALVLILYLRKPKTFRFSWDSFRFEFRNVLTSCRFGLTSFFTQFCIVVIAIVNNLVIIKYGELSQYGGSMTISAFVVVMKVNTIVQNISLGLILGALPVIGYNYGAGQISRVKEIFRKLVTISAISSLFFTILFQCIPTVFLRLFGNADNELYIQLATRIMRIYLALILLCCLQKIMSIYLQCVGKTRIATVLSLLRDGFLLLFAMSFPLLISGTEKINGVIYSGPAADIIAFIITVLIFASVYRHLAAPKKSGGTAKVLLPTHIGPVITLSRQHGVKAGTVSRILSEKLDAPVYDKTVSAAVAENIGLAEEFVGMLTENTDALVASIRNNRELTIDFLGKLSDEYRKIAGMGASVFLGRGAEYVLRDNPNIIRVFLKANDDYRIENVMKSAGISHRDAEKLIRESDRSRAEYFNLISGKDYYHLENYDFVIDASVGPERTAELILEIVNAKTFS